MKRIAVQVIIVNYKSSRLTLECLDSLESERASEALDLHVVVVENSSGDGPELERALANRPGVSLVNAERNGGFAYGNNLGFRFAYERGSVPAYFHLLNPDTRVFPGAVSELARFLENHHNVGIAGSSIQNQDGSDWPIAFRFPTFASEIDDGVRTGILTRLLRPWVVSREMGKRPERVDWLPGASMMIRRETLEALGGLDEEYFLYFEETDFCLKALRAGWECWYVPQSRIMHIAGQSTGVTTRGVKPRRHPDYWFESRRRFFAKNYGVGYAALTDAVALTAWALGRVRRVASGHGDDDPPHYMGDLLRHSPLLRRNRPVRPEQNFRPRSSP